MCQGIHNEIFSNGCRWFYWRCYMPKIIKNGSEVVAVDNLNSYYDVNLKLARLALFETDKNFTFIKLDIANREAVAELFKKYQFE